MKKIVLSLIFLSLSNAYAMKESNKKVSINTVEDIKPFVGKLVLFSSDNTYFSRDFDPYKLDPKSNLIVALIFNSACSEQKKPIYEMARLLTYRATPNACYLTNYCLKNSNLKMREATDEEKAVVIAIVNTQEAELEYMLASCDIEKKWNKFKSEFQKDNGLS